jgi:hypothetical protein
MYSIFNALFGDFNSKSNTSIYSKVLYKFDTEDNTLNARESLSNKKWLSTTGGGGGGGGNGEYVRKSLVNC